MLTPRTLRQQYPEATTAESPEGVQARAVSSVSYELPEGLVTKSVTYSYERLLLGGLMLLDEEHPLPDGAPGAQYHERRYLWKGHGAGERLKRQKRADTIQALAELFWRACARRASAVCAYGAVH